MRVSKFGALQHITLGIERDLCKQAMHALFEDIHVDFKFSTAEQLGTFAIQSMQIDNQLLTSARPVVLSHDAAPPQVITLWTLCSSWSLYRHRGAGLLGMQHCLQCRNPHGSEYQ